MNDGALTPTLRAAAELSRAFLRSATALLSLGALAYLIGWRQTSIYYEALGAPWITRLLSPTSFMQTSAPIVGTTAACTFSMVYGVASSSITHRGTRWGAVATLGLAFLFSSLGHGLFELFGPGGEATCLSLAVFFFAISSGLTLAEIVARYEKYGFKWSPYYLWLLGFVGLQVFVWAPKHAGQAAAKRIIHTPSSLPIAVLAGDETSNVWRLLEATDGYAILLLSTGSPREYSYRIVPLDALDAIRSSFPPKK